jgi:uncharacterized protein YjbI with pentapeptide repeats
MVLLAMPHTSPCEEERQVDDQQQSRGPTRKQFLWTVGILAVIVGGCIFLRFAYVREWEWTGLVKDPDFHKRTLWDWLNLLIVPAVLALGGYLFARSENRRTRDDADQQRRLDRKIADDRRQDDPLQAYLDGMSQLLTDRERPLYRAQRGDTLSSVARARALTVLPRLDGDRKARVVQFLYESDLIAKDRVVLALVEADLIEGQLRGAQLREANLGRTLLSRANLSTARLFKADLERADLQGANMKRANLQGAILAGAYLRLANLSEANLQGAMLGGAYLRGANLKEANLKRAYLGEADLQETNLSGADLRDADLSDATLYAKDGQDQILPGQRRTILTDANLELAPIGG